MPKLRRSAIPRSAMILAAGYGTRMRPLTDSMPKPLVPVGGKALINHVLDRLAAVGVETAVVNVHHFADQIEQHLKPRRAPRIAISDEREAVLGTGGGIAKALPLLGTAPFFHVNSDPLWIDGVKPNLERLATAFEPDKMDALLLLAPTPTSVGYAARADLAVAPAGRASRRPRGTRRLLDGARRQAAPPRRTRGRALRLCGDRDPVAGPFSRRAERRF